MVDIRLELPDELAQEADSQGLLTPDSMEVLLRSEVRRRRADDFFVLADRLSALKPPITEEEILAEVQAAREEKRAASTSRT